MFLALGSEHLSLAQAGLFFHSNLFGRNSDAALVTAIGTLL
ncbi:hypothetical protein PAMC26577_04885 [Caballeronia sordidicola]|uniref:Uncharacterized protein n=1 Tax=Caballeronia sordidicola TaxID=196367 RepID=A0A242N4I8_CABSO|nr:hypothetical protein PAMC26577_04885 [Caballeronia sordidicola]